MGYSVKGQLSYGIPVGFEEDRFGFGFDNPDAPVWVQDEYDPIGHATQLLLASVAGFTETWSEGNDGYHRRRAEAEKRLGVTFELFGLGDYAGYLLAAKHLHASGPWPVTIDKEALAVPDDANATLLHAAEVLGLPCEPAWMLTGLYF